MKPCGCCLLAAQPNHLVLSKMTPYYSFDICIAKLDWVHMLCLQGADNIECSLMVCWNNRKKFIAFVVESTFFTDGLAQSVSSVT